MRSNAASTTRAGKSCWRRPWTDLHLPVLVQHSGHKEPAYAQQSPARAHRLQYKSSPLHASPQIHLFGKSSATTISHVMQGYFEYSATQSIKAKARLACSNTKETWRTQGMRHTALPWLMCWCQEFTWGETAGLGRSRHDHAMNSPSNHERHDSKALQAKSLLKQYPVCKFCRPAEHIRTVICKVRVVRAGSNQHTGQAGTCSTYCPSSTVQGACTAAIGV